MNMIHIITSGHLIIQIITFTSTSSNYPVQVGHHPWAMEVCHLNKLVPVNIATAVPAQGVWFHLLRSRPSRWHLSLFYVSSLLSIAMTSLKTDCLLSYTQSDVLTSVMSVIGYIHHLLKAAILTAVYDLFISLRIFLCQVSWKFSTKASFSFSGSPYCTKCQLEGLY